MGLRAGSASLLAAKAVLTPSLKEKTLAFTNAAQWPMYGDAVLSPAHILLSLSSLPPLFPALCLLDGSFVFHPVPLRL